MTAAEADPNVEAQLLTADIAVPSERVLGAPYRTVMDQAGIAGCAEAAAVTSVLVSIRAAPPPGLSGRGARMAPAAG